MVHDHERERTLADGPDHIGDRGEGDGDRPDFLLDSLLRGPLISEGRNGQHHDQDRVDDKTAHRISKHGVHPGFC